MKNDKRHECKKIPEKHGSSNRLFAENIGSKKSTRKLWSPLRCPLSDNHPFMETAFPWLMVIMSVGFFTAVNTPPTQIFIRLSIRAIWTIFYRQS